jgi:hypothetical protein
MPKPVIVTIPHRLTKSEARERLRSGFGRIRSQLQAQFVGKLASIEDQWTEDRMEFRAVALGQTVTGRFDVLDDAVRVEVDLPWFLAALTETLRTRIRQEGTRLLEKK